MYLMKTITAANFFALFVLCFVLNQSQAQSILGTWQLAKQTTCLTSELKMTGGQDSLLSEMRSRSGASAQIVKFKEKGAGEESVRILNKSKYADDKKFLYRFDGQALHILDKKSRTLIESYQVEKIAADSLILSNASRPCETKIFIKIRDAK
jgi:hypothetical protein